MTNKRICPDDVIIAKYLGGKMASWEKTPIEEHLAGCQACRKLVAEAHDVLKGEAAREKTKRSFRFIAKNIWFIGAFIMLVASFFVSKYFLQFLAASLLMGAKWIIDNRATRLMVMVKDALKDEKSETHQTSTHDKT